MSNFRRRLMMSIKKKENFDDFQELEYIESTGTQYIDTEIFPIVSYKIKPIINIECSINDISYSQRIFGAWEPPTKFFQFFNNVNQLGIQAYNTSNYTIFTQNTDKHAYIFDFKNNKAYQDDEEKNLSYLNGNLNNPLYLFARNHNGKTDNYFSGRIYYFKYNDGTQYKKLIPCYRKSDGEIGMYDLVNNVFYTNKGSGTFTKGPDVVTNYFNYEDFYNNYVTVTQSNVGRYAIKLEPNTSYIVSTNLKYGNSAKVFAVSGSNTNWAPSTINNGVLPDKPRTITTDSQGYMCIGIYISGANIVNKSEFENGTAWVKIKKL